MIRAVLVLALLMVSKPSAACTIRVPAKYPHVLDPAEAADTVAPMIASVSTETNRSEPEAVETSKHPRADVARKSLLPWAPSTIGLRWRSSATCWRRGRRRLAGWLEPWWTDPGTPAIQDPQHRFTHDLSYEDEDEDYDFELEVRVVDLNGNVSEVKIARSHQAAAGAVQRPRTAAGCCSRYWRSSCGDVGC